MAVDELKFASVLFADLCGSTELVSAFDPEEARRYLLRIGSLMKEAVRTYGGTVTEAVGDGLQALFGAPVAQEDHALRACLAAIDMQRRARDVGDGSQSLALRIGIASGEVIVGEVVLGTAGDPFSRRYRADGSTMHLGSRLEQLASPGTVLISGATMRLAGEQVEATSLGAQAIRGFRGEVEVYELVTRAPRSAAAPLARRRQMTAMVGRSTTLATMHAVARQVLSGSMRVLALRGEAGIGKSRLIAEFCKQLDDRFTAHCVAAHSYARHVSYGVVTELVRVLLGVPLDMEPEPQREAARAIVAGWPDADRVRRAAIYDLLDLGEPDSEWRALMPASRRRQLADVVFWLVTRRLASSPLLLVIEDVFLADRDSERLIESLVRRLENMPVLFCVTYRQDYGGRWIDEPWLVECQVGPLSPKEMTALAHSLLGTDPSLRPSIDLLVERADGNPFFLEQLAITLIDDGTFVGAPCAYVCVDANARPSVPGSIAGVIAARVDRLPAATKASLEAAAILGEPASSNLIATICGIAPEEADNHLMLAVSLGLLAAPPLGDQPRYRFRHGLVQEVVAGALTRPRRKSLHRAAFVAMKKQQGDAWVERAALLAHHAYNGEDWAAAAEHALASMTRSIARSANRDAVRAFELGIDAVRRLDDGPAAIDVEFALCVESLGALLPLGRIEPCLPNLARAEAIAVRLGDVRRQAAVSLQLAMIHWTRGSYLLAMEAAGKAAAAGEASGSRSLRMAARHAAMTIHHALGRYAEVVREARTIIADFADGLAERELIRGWAVIAAVNVKVFLADALRRMDEIDEAQRVCSEAYGELGHPEHVFSRVLVDFVQGEIWSVNGRFDETVALYRGALEACKAHDNVTMVPAFVAGLAGALARSGRANEAIAMLEQATADQLYLQGGRYNDFYFPMNLAIALTEAGRYAEALDAAEAALAVASSYDQRGHRAQALFALAEIECAAARPDRAQAHYREAADAASECAMFLVRRHALARLQQLDESTRLLTTLQRRGGVLR